MDGEFDRELDDGGWGPINPSDQWKPLGTQANNTLLAASEVMSHKHNKEKPNKEEKQVQSRLEEMKDRIEQLVTPIRKMVMGEV